MSRSKTKPEKNFDHGWTKTEREYCVEQYFLHRESIAAAKRCYSKKFRVQNEKDLDKCPTSAHIRAWVTAYEAKLKSAIEKQTEEAQKTATGKLSGTQWGRKTGETRIIISESVDMELQLQAFKCKQRNSKWSRRPVNVKEKIEVPVNEEHQYHTKSWYKEPAKEEVKPDKKQVLEEKFEGEVLELVKSLEAHGHAARASAFDSLREALRRRPVDSLLAAHRTTLIGHVTQALWRGEDDEKKAAAAIAPLLAIQIGEEGMEQFVREVRPGLIAIATDTSASLDTRTKCCSSLAVLCYLMDEDITDTLEVMRTYESIFSGSYLKNESSVKLSGAAVEGAWHAAALDGWALLLPLLSPNHALSLLNNQAPSFARLGELLEAPSLEVRMAAGGALAVAYETVSDDNNGENALNSQGDMVLPRLNELARDTHKFFAKRDRKIQQATFRDILKYFEEGEAPITSAYIGTEKMTRSSLTGGAVYAALAAALGGALQVLAPRCSRLRAVLQLSSEAPKDMARQKIKKLQRRRQNKVTCKVRNRQRDKRSLIFASV